jgi:hypothetical protein
MLIVYNYLPENFGSLLYNYLFSQLGVFYEVSGESCQLVTAFHDECDGLMLNE